MPDVSEQCIASIFRVYISASDEPAWVGGCRRSSETSVLCQFYTMPRPRRGHSSFQILHLQQFCWYRYTLKCIDIWSSCLATRNQLSSWDQFSLYSVLYINGIAQNIVITLLSASLHRTQLKLGWSENFWCTLIGLSFREVSRDFSGDLSLLCQLNCFTNNTDFTWGALRPGVMIPLSLFLNSREKITYSHFHKSLFFNICGHAVQAGEMVRLLSKILYGSPQSLQGIAELG
jgi:hypothetical protein